MSPIEDRWNELRHDVSALLVEMDFLRCQWRLPPHYLDWFGYSLPHHGGPQRVMTVDYALKCTLQIGPIYYGYQSGTQRALRMDLLDQPRDDGKEEFPLAVAPTDRYPGY